MLTGYCGDLLQRSRRAHVPETDVTQPFGTNRSRFWHRTQVLERLPRERRRQGLTFAREQHITRSTPTEFRSQGRLLRPIDKLLSCD